MEGFKSKMDKHDREEIVAAILATGIIQKQTLPGQRGADPSPVYMVSLFHQVLAELRRGAAAGAERS